MGVVSDSAARIDRLRGLYVEQFREQFDTAEFIVDDFYAFQVLERACQAGEKNRELNNLALLMHAERKALMETGQRRMLEAMRNTDPATMPGVETPAVPNHTGRLRTMSARPERRSGRVRLSSHEITMLSALRRAYHKHYGQGFDVEEFAVNDLYAKVVLAEAVSSGQDEMIELARGFLDGEGKPRLHRRLGKVDVELNVFA
ncbi:MAG: hypothetical protein JWN73_2050 [Betaproteobacteria bacterium]|nr:hypothetical protein [Betaproteobacteria bacterium]